MSESNSDTGSSNGRDNSPVDNIKGTVKWFNDAKGFGFIEHPSGRDVFVHYSVIEVDGFKTLKDGEPVEYEIKEGPKGLHAARVRRSATPESGTPETSTSKDPGTDGLTVTVERSSSDSSTVESGEVRDGAGDNGNGAAAINSAINSSGGQMQSSAAGHQTQSTVTVN